MTLESVEKALGVKVFWTLPNNYPVAIAAVNQGFSIQDCDPKSDIAKSYAGLTDFVLNTFMHAGSTKAEAEDEKRSGLFGRFLPPVRGLTK
jgi:Flp pilus assembly CpaE family ATPase